MGSTLYVVYCKAGDELFAKIGVAKIPKTRMMSLQIGNPLLLDTFKVYYLCNAWKVERRIHEALSAYHVRGEWFRCSEHLNSTVQRIIDEYGVFGQEEASSDNEWLETNIANLRQALLGRKTEFRCATGTEPDTLLRFLEAGNRLTFDEAWSIAEKTGMCSPTLKSWY
jgi:hypothetical protein|tara:strand:+ start:1004 stop:1507 length:504 start_codon:yes stop_codon:yes gene_type:complete